MANGHGGYRTPTNPSPVSGPGALSQRTDGPLHGPIPGTLPAQASNTLPGPDPLAQLTPFGAPSERPEEPITAGMPGGPGGGPALPSPSGLTQEEQDRLRSYLPVLIFQASQPDANPQIKQYVRQLRGELG